MQEEKQQFSLRNGGSSHGWPDLFAVLESITNVKKNTAFSNLIDCDMFVFLATPSAFE